MGTPRDYLGARLMAALSCRGQQERRFGKVATELSKSWQNRGLITPSPSRASQRSRQKGPGGKIRAHTENLCRNPPKYHHPRLLQWLHQLSRSVLPPPPVPRSISVKSTARQKRICLLRKLC